MRELKSAITLFLLTLAVSSSLAAVQGQTPNPTVPQTVWENYYGEAEPYGGVTALIQTSDNGFAFVSRATSYSGNYYCPEIYKVEASGQLQWIRSTQLANCAGIVQTGDGGYVVAGNILAGGFLARAHSAEVLSLLKFSRDGDLLWNKTVQELRSVKSLLQARDGGFLLSNESQLLKTDSLGNLEWNNTALVYGKGVIQEIIQPDNQGYVLVGRVGVTSFNSRGAAFWLAEIGLDGNITQSSTFDVSKLGDIEQWSVTQTPDGNYAFIADTLPDASTHLTVLWKMDSSGKLIWNQTLREISIYSDFNYHSEPFTVTSDSGFAVCGSCAWGACVLKTDRNGVLEWNQSYHKQEQGTFEVMGNCILEARDGTLVFAGVGASIPPYRCILTKIDATLPTPTASPTPIYTPAISNPASPEIIVAIVLTITIVLLGLLSYRLKKTKK